MIPEQGGETTKSEIEGEGVFIREEEVRCSLNCICELMISLEQVKYQFMMCYYKRENANYMIPGGVRLEVNDRGGEGEKWSGGLEARLRGHSSLSSLESKSFTVTPSVWLGDPLVTLLLNFSKSGSEIQSSWNIKYCIT